MTSNPYETPQSVLPHGYGAPVSLVTPRVLVAAHRCRPWLFVLSMACFLALALSAVSLLLAEGEYNEKGLWVEAPTDVGTLVGAGISGLIQLLCGLFFWKFGVALGKFVGSRNETNLLTALRSELNVIRVVGITALVYVILIGVAIASGFLLSRGALDDETPPPAEEESAEAAN